MYYTYKKTNIYSAPQIHSDIIGTIPAKTDISLKYAYVDDSESAFLKGNYFQDWRYVTYNNISGWVYVLTGYTAELDTPSTVVEKRNNEDFIIIKEDVKVYKNPIMRRENNNEEEENECYCQPKLFTQKEADEIIRNEYKGKTEDESENFDIGKTLRNDLYLNYYNVYQMEYEGAEVRYTVLKSEKHNNMIGYVETFMKRDDGKNNLSPGIVIIIKPVKQGSEGSTIVRITFNDEKKAQLFLNKYNNEFKTNIHIAKYENYYK